MRYNKVLLSYQEIYLNSYQEVCLKELFIEKFRRFPKENILACIEMKVSVTIVKRNITLNN